MSAAQQIDGGWVLVSEQLPKSGRAVLAHHKNRLGFGRTIRAAWVSAKTEVANEEYSDIGVYDDETDTYYDPEGWYEQIDNWDDYSSVAVNEGEVTHWMPMPLSPDAAPVEPALDTQAPAVPKACAFDAWIASKGDEGVTDAEELAWLAGYRAASKTQGIGQEIESDTIYMSDIDASVRQGGVETGE